MSVFEQTQILRGIAANIDKIAVSVDAGMIHITKEQFKDIIASVFEGGFEFGRADNKFLDVLKYAFDGKVKPLSLNENAEVFKIVKLYLDW